MAIYVSTWKKKRRRKMESCWSVRNTNGVSGAEAVAKITSRNWHTLWK